MSSGKIRCGTCSVCRAAMESTDGTPEKAQVRSRELRKRGHQHKQSWHVVPDEPPGDYRYWHDQARGFAP